MESLQVDRKVFTDSFDVVVYGASYSGLASAVKLLSKGLKVLIVDANPGLVPSCYYGGVDGMVFLRESVLEKIGLRRNRGSRWLYSLELLSAMATRFFNLGGRMMLGYRVEPVFNIVGEDITLLGVALKEFTGDEEFYEDKVLVEASYLVDSSGLVATLSTYVIEVIKPGIVPQGAGPVIPGSREVVEKTEWVLENIVLACGLSAATIFGAALPFPDVTPLIESGVKAAEMIIESMSSRKSS